MESFGFRGIILYIVQPCGRSGPTHVMLFCTAWFWSIRGNSWRASRRSVPLVISPWIGGITLLVAVPESAFAPFAVLFLPIWARFYRVHVCGVASAVRLFRSMRLELSVIMSSGFVAAPATPILEDTLQPAVLAFAQPHVLVPCLFLLLYHSVTSYKVANTATHVLLIYVFLLESSFWSCAIHLLLFGRRFGFW